MGGILLDKNKSKLIYENGQELPIYLLKGLDILGDINWSSIRSVEFFQLIKIFNYFERNGLFDDLHDIELLFNYMNSIIEFDIITILSDEKGDDVIINIEYKEIVEGDSKEQTIKKLENQINKREKEFMPLLFPNKKYVLIGITSEKYLYCKYNNGEEVFKIQNLSELKNLFSTFKSVRNFYQKIIDCEYYLNLNEIFSNIKNGKMKYYQETIDKYLEIVDSLNNNNNKLTVAIAGPGKGKTILAFKLFFEMNRETKLLLLNQKLYNTLNLFQYYRIGQAYFGTDSLLNNNLKNTVVIIDEFQRLNKDKFIQIVKASKQVVVFGDLKQSFGDDDLNLEINQFNKLLIENEISHKNIYIKDNKRYHDSVDELLSSFTQIGKKSVNQKKYRSFANYEVNVYLDEREFLLKYEQSKRVNKIYTLYDYHRNNCIFEIDGRIFEKAAFDDYSFSTSINTDYCIGHTLHAISFDVDSCFLYLPNLILKKLNGKDVLFIKDREFNYSEIRRILNELNILFTRGKKSLNIYTKNIEVYLFLMSKIRS